MPTQKKARSWFELATLAFEIRSNNLLKEKKALSGV